MEVKSKMKRLGLLSQAVLASTIVVSATTMISTTARAAEFVLNGADKTVGAGGGNPANGDWIYAKSNHTIDFNGAPQNLGISDGSGFAAAGFSFQTTAPSQGKIDFNQAGALTVNGQIGDSTNTLNLITVSNTGPATLLGSTYADDITITKAGAVAVLTFKGATNVSGAGISLTTAQNHVVNVDSTNNDMTLTLNNGAGDINNTAGNNGIINFLGGKTITFNGTIGEVNNEPIEVNVNGAGTIVNVSGNIKATDIKLLAANTLNVNDSLTLEGAVKINNVAGIININNNKLDVDGSFDSGNVASTLATQVSDATSKVGTDKGTIITTGNMTTNANNLLVVTPVGYLTQGGLAGAPIKLITNGGGGGAPAAIPAANITGQSAVLSFGTQIIAGNHLQLDVTRRAYNSGVHNLNDQAAGLGAALESDGAAGRLAASNPDFEAFVGNVDRLATSAEVAAALSTAAPTVNSAVVSTAHEIGERVLVNVNKRMTQIAQNGQGAYNTGMSAGDMTSEGWGVWGELFGSDFTQDKRNNIEGYDGNLWGVTLGVDWMVDNATLLGLAATYSTTSVDHDLANNTLDVDSFQGSLYGSFTCDPWYVQGMLGIAHHDYDQTRNVIVGATTMGRALGDYKAWEWLANAEVGYIWTDGVWNVIPSASLRYSHLDIDDYTETGGSGFNLAVRNEDVNAFVAGLGLKVQYNNVYGGSRIVPEAHVGAFYDFIADRQETSSTIFGTGTAFNSKGFDPAHDSYEVGVGLNIYTEKNSIFSINYDYHFKSDFHSHNGFVKLRYQW